jgi:hypothetical protein
MTTLTDAVTLNHVPATTPVETIVEHLRRDNYVIIDDLVSQETMDVVQAELAPYLDATPSGYNAMIGKKTRRTGALIARSPECRKIIQNSTILNSVAEFLNHASTFQLMLTQVISIDPGETAQALHRDQSAWDYYPFPEDYHVQCNTLWAMSDYTAEMGATRIVPGSHLPGSRKQSEYRDDECLQAEMTRGSVLLYSGKIVHSGGANRSQITRQAININYSVGWVRQEENQYLSVPMEVARTLDDDLLKLIGFQEAGFGIGYFRDFENPIRAVRGNDYVGYEFDPSGLTESSAVEYNYMVGESE